MGGNIPSGSFPDTEKFTMLLNFIRSFYFLEHLKWQFIHNWYSFEGVLMVLNFKDTLKAFGDFKNKQKVYSIHNTLRQNTNVRKNSFGQNKQYKKCLLFSLASSNSLVLFLIYDSNMNWSTRFCLYKTVCEIFHFWFRFD